MELSQTQTSSLSLILERTLCLIVIKLLLYIRIVGKSSFVSHIKHTAEAANMDLFHS